MSFVSSIFGGGGGSNNGSGGSFSATVDPNAIANEQAQNKVLTGAETNLTNQANGTGPNPALAQLKSTTDANIQGANSLIASQKGINPALAARLAGENAANANQQAAGQAALTSQTGQQNAQNLVGQLAVGGANSAQSGVDSANKTNAIIQSGNQGAQQGLLGGAGALLTGLFADGGMVAPIAAPPVPGVVPQPSSETPSDKNSMSKAASYLKNGPQNFDSSAQKLGSALGAGIKSLWAPSTSPSAQPTIDPLSTSDYYKNMDNLGSSTAYKALPDARGEAPQFSADQLGSGDAGMADNEAPGSMMAAHGGKVPAKVSPGEIYIPPSKVGAAAKGKDVRAIGEKIPGKATVKGDSLKNDTVSKNLDAGGIVIPRSVVESDDPHGKAHAFVSAILAKKGLRGRR